MAVMPMPSPSSRPSTSSSVALEVTGTVRTVAPPSSRRPTAPAEAGRSEVSSPSRTISYIRMSHPPDPGSRQDARRACSELLRVIFFWHPASAASTCEDDSARRYSEERAMVAPRQLRMTPPGASMGLIERPGLVAMVEARPVTVLAGVAGYGKSTLLAAAAARRPGGSVWLTLDDTDKDPVRFVGDLVTATAVAGIEPLADQVERLRVSSLRAEPLSLVDSLLEALYDSAEPHLLVLDDLQHLAGSGASTTIVDHLLRWAPANLKIAMAARVVPPLRLQRLRLEDRLTYLAHDDLAFSLDESAAAVRAAQLDLDPSTVTTIQQATDGWPAGVR